MTGTTASSSNQVTGVTGSANVVNGSPITGTNIPAGTYILSGAGTSTYTLSANATGANAGLTVNSSITQLNIHDNVFHQTINATNYVSYFANVRNSTIARRLPLRDRSGVDQHDGRRHVLPAVRMDGHTRQPRGIPGRVRDRME